MMHSKITVARIPPVMTTVPAVIRKALHQHPETERDTRARDGERQQTVLLIKKELFNITGSRLDSINLNQTGQRNKPCTLPPPPYTALTHEHVWWEPEAGTGSDAGCNGGVMPWSRASVTSSTERLERDQRTVRRMEEREGVIAELVCVCACVCSG